MESGNYPDTTLRAFQPQHGLVTTRGANTRVAAARYPGNHENE
jgi:hypothetical protein